MVQVVNETREHTKVCHFPDADMGSPGTGRPWEKAWNSWGDHGFPMLLLLSHALQKHRKASEHFQATSAEHGLAWKPWHITFL